jgi:adenine-specific DNA-methyltransferase
LGAFVEIDLDQLSKNELVAMVRANKSRLKLGLVWEDNPEEIVEFSKENLPYLVRDEDKSFKSNKKKEHNVLLEGDNFQSLLALTATHAGKIDCIYIDPPYNTGAKDWIYNNDYVDSNDTYRHSKWLSMMKNRLELAKVLLKDDGVLICAIDENEFTRLGLLIEKIFTNHENHCVTIVHNPRGIQGRNFSYTHEYAYFTFERGQKVIGDRRIPLDEVKWSNLRNWGGESERSDAKNCFYPIIIKDEKIIGFGEVSSDDEHPTQNVEKNGQVFIYPIDKNGIERKWRYARQSVEDVREHLRIKKSADGYDIEIGRPFETVRTMWRDPRYDANIWGTKLVEAMVPNNGFDFPKSVWTTYDCIAPVVKDRKDSIILDFFAGSGTTGHAVQLLNLEDGGTRRFILCTNNENKIAEKVTHQRLKALTKKVVGYEEVTGIDFNLDYFKIETVKKSANYDEKILDFLDLAVPYIQMNEDVFDVVVETETFGIYASTEKCVGIYHSLDPTEMTQFREHLLKRSGDVLAYIATLDPQGLQKFDLFGWEGVTIKALPGAIVSSMEANLDN